MGGVTNQDRAVVFPAPFTTGEARVKESSVLSKRSRKGGERRTVGRSLVGAATCGGRRDDAFDHGFRVHSATVEHVPPRGAVAAALTVWASNWIVDPLSSLSPSRTISEWIGISRDT